MRFGSSLQLKYAYDRESGNPRRPGMSDSVEYITVQDHADIQKAITLLEFAFYLLGLRKYKTKSCS